MDQEKFAKSKYLKELPTMVKQMESMRRSTEGSVDITLEDFIQKKHQASLEDLLEDLGIDPSFDTVENIFTLPDESVRWLIPELFREAIRLGLRKAPIWSTIITAEQTIKQPQINQPWFNMSEAAPQKVGEGETIGLGNVSYGQKTIKISKIGRGFRIPYEVRNYTTVNIMSIFLQDFGIKLGQAIDTLAIDTLLNGDQANGSESAPVIGIATPGTFKYRDLLRVWLRMSRISRLPDSIIGGEAAALDTLDLPEFKTNQFGTNAAAGVPSSTDLRFKTPLPNTTNYWIHAAVPANQQILIDPNSALIKYNAQPLLMESEKIVSNQTEATYCSLTTGFSNVFRDARVVLDSSLDFATYGFPDYMNVDEMEVVNIE